MAALDNGTLVVVLPDPSNPAAPHGLGTIAELRPVGGIPRAALVQLQVGGSVLVGLSRLAEAA